MRYEKKKLKICPKITEVSVTPKGRIKLLWTEIPDVDKYVVKRSETPNGEYGFIGWTQGTEYIDKKVKKDITYWYRVIAVKKVIGKRAYKRSSPIVAKVVSSIPAPTDLTVSSLKQGVIKLKWNIPEGVNGFIVNRRNDFFNQIIPVGKVYNNKFVDRDIVSGQVYHYSVQSITEDDNGIKEGNFSPEVSCVCLDCGQILEAKARAFKNVDIKVRIVAGADGYIIERSADGKNYKEIARGDSSVKLRYRDKADKMFTRYYYRTRSYKVVDGEEYISKGSKPVKIKSR